MSSVPGGNRSNMDVRVTLRQLHDDERARHDPIETECVAAGSRAADDYLR